MPLLLTSSLGFGNIIHVLTVINKHPSCFIHSSSAYTSVYEQVGDHTVYASAGAQYVSHTK